MPPRPRPSLTIKAWQSQPPKQALKALKLWLQVRTASCSGTACVNSFGDEQLAVDMLADKLLFEALKYSGVCSQAVSEEVPEPVNFKAGESAAGLASWPRVLYCSLVGPLDGLWVLASVQLPPSQLWLHLHFP
jgi:fructose-1,6-bisphosphatase